MLQRGVFYFNFPFRSHASVKSTQFCLRVAVIEIFAFYIMKINLTDVCLFSVENLPVFIAVVIFISFVETCFVQY